jgi:hypothetical protein
MTHAEQLAAYVGDYVRDTGLAMPIESIMRKAIDMKTMAGSRMFNEFGQWFMEFSFIDESNITYGMDEEGA